MKRSGFSLVELVTVMAIIGTLLTIGTLSFNTISIKYAIESQTRGIYTDLMDIRLKSLYKKKSHFIKLSETAFICYSSGTRSIPNGVLLTKSLAYPITWNGTNTDLIEFDSRGLTTDQRSICVTRNETAPQIDCIVISMSRQNMGKRKAGRDCDADYITIK